MKKIFVIAFLLIAGLALSPKAAAQDNNLEITIDIADKASATGNGHAITVTVQGSQPGYTYLLYDAEPWKGSRPVRIVKSKNESTQSFYDLKTGVYHVCVLDAKENLACKKVDITTR